MTNHRSLENLRPVPFEPGNDVAVTHGAYARHRLSEEAGDTADVLRELVPPNHDADEPTIQAFACVLEQLRAAGEELTSAEAGRLAVAGRLLGSVRSRAHRTRRPGGAGPSR